MFRPLLMLVAVASLAASARADLITRWTFNSNPSDGSTTTGTLTPSFGSGTASVLGGLVQAYATGSSDDPSAAGNDNSGLQLSGFPAQSTASRTAGARFDAGTAGFSGVNVSFALRLTATASRFLRFQYTLNGSDFVDGPGFSVPLPGAFTNLSVDLSSVAGVQDNPSFGFRLVTEFASDAGVAGGSVYLSVTAGTSAAYSPNGTMRLDMVTISGTPAGNNAPTITSLTNQVIRANSSTPAQPFTVGDLETPAAQLGVTGRSSNPGLIPDGAINIGGTGAARDVSVTPLPDQTGNATITLIVLDGGGKSNTASYVVTVRPTNTPPTISAIDPQFLVRNTASAPIPFTVNDEETPVNELVITTTSDNEEVIANLGMEVTGDTTNRSLFITPNPGMIGRARITVTVSDGTLSSARTFVASVLSSAAVLLEEPFNYGNGFLTNVSGGLWTAHSGAGNGSVAVDNQRALVTSSGAEDVNAPLARAPYTAAAGSNLYASFTVSFAALPNAIGDYFAHFRDTTTGFRCRLFAATTNAPFGSFRLGIANTANAASFANVTMAPVDLSFDTVYRIVMRYSVGTGVSTLWINPESEASTSYVATDENTNRLSISSFALRQSAGIGDVYVDDLRVALTFNAATGVPDYRLTVNLTSEGAVEVSWPAEAMDAGLRLQWSPEMPAAGWSSVEPTGVTDGRAYYILTAPQAVPTGFFRLARP